MSVDSKTVDAQIGDCQSHRASADVRALAGLPKGAAMRTRVTRHSSVAVAVFIALSSLVGAAWTTSSAIAKEMAVAPEANPPGDIPDTQVFVNYSSPLGFSLKVPEGWARTERQDGARFADKYNAVDVAVAPAAQAPTIASVKSGDAANLVKGGRAVKIESVTQMTLQTGSAFLIVYTSNSEPNPVTNKQLRLRSDRYLIYRSGRLATVDLSAPLGADNVDQWKLISNSFRWR
ncbi:hypothetical protein NUV25_19050 [Burkholderia pseudomultivorans]|uniref:hypothetical protein n=1 Tax=Burkholderia pseudomultivorans TaxID=1207504 RepID=UPI002875DA0D|nr:hypothetical protein [Burkholderia pseudomultivorans]MDS0859809.1 hypothetical protein [Burkholderia pseudomultivorans]